MSVGPFQLLIILLVLLLLFGRGRISDILGDVGRGVRAFRRGLKPDEEARPLPVEGPAHEAPQGEFAANPADN